MPRNEDSRLNSLRITRDECVTIPEHSSEVNVAFSPHLFIAREALVASVLEYAVQRNRVGRGAVLHTMQHRSVSRQLDICHSEGALGATRTVSFISPLFFRTSLSQPISASLFNKLSARRQLSRGGGYGDGGSIAAVKNTVTSLSLIHI